MLNISPSWYWSEAEPKLGWPSCTGQRDQDVLTLQMPLAGQHTRLLSLCCEWIDISARFENSIHLPLNLWGAWRHFPAQWNTYLLVHKLVWTPEGRQIILICALSDSWWQPAVLNYNVVQNAKLSRQKEAFVDLWGADTSMKTGKTRLKTNHPRGGVAEGSGQLRHLYSCCLAKDNIWTYAKMLACSWATKIP